MPYRDIIETISGYAHHATIDMRLGLYRGQCAVIAILLVCALFLSCTQNGLSCMTQEPNDNGSAPPSQSQLPASTALPVVQLDITSFQAQPKHLTAGENTTLSWKTRGATSISIDTNIGAISENSGNIEVSPKETTLYTLKASNGPAEISTKFLVIVKAADGSVVWPGSTGSAVQEPMWEGWTFYPNKYIDWVITDNYTDPYGDTGNCWHIGFITNNHPEWMMTEVTINKKPLNYTILPGYKQGYTIAIDCQQPPEMQWKWKKK